MRLCRSFLGAQDQSDRRVLALLHPVLTCVVQIQMHLAGIRDGALVRIAGSVVVRQRPGTAKGFVFLSMEDETGMMNAIVNPATFEHFKFEVLGEPYLIIDGILQNQDGVISVKAGRVAALCAGAAPESHDFH